jgi:5-formyltetrahydrofolate cyclo-ligase
MNKTQLRKQYKELRNSISSEQREISDAIIFKTFLNFLKNIKNINVIAGYMPINNELDIRSLLKSLTKEGYKLCLPFINSNKNMEFKEYKQNKMLVKGRYDILQPLESLPSIYPDLIIVPLLACDIQGNRLGYGAGYYDKITEFFNKQGHQFLLVSLCYELQVAENLPVDKHDLKLNLIITEKQILKLS